MIKVAQHIPWFSKHEVKSVEQILCDYNGKGLNIQYNYKAQGDEGHLSDAKENMYMFNVLHYTGCYETSFKDFKGMQYDRK